MTSNRRWSVSADSRRALPKTLMVRGLTGGGGLRMWLGDTWVGVVKDGVRSSAVGLSMGLGIQECGW